MNLVFVIKLKSVLLNFKILSVGFSLKTYFMYISVFVQMHVCEPCVCLVPAEVRRIHWVPETGVLDSCESPSGC